MTVQNPSFHTVDGSQLYTPVVGPEGPQGEQGETGPQGPTGAQGPQGEVGPAGPQGPQGDQGVQGDTGLTGPQGDTGPAGPAGADGVDGVDGSTVFEWAPNFTSDGDLYIPAVEAMTIDVGVAAIGTGTVTYTKSTTAAPSTFGATTLPTAVQAGAWLKVSVTGVTGFKALHLTRTA